MGEEKSKNPGKVCYRTLLSVNMLIIFYRFSPVHTVPEWSTPQMLIHGSKDYRLPESESISAFHALQQSVIFLLALFRRMFNYFCF
jgi:dipeptidyl aminopeptidase/acylaminoacyl peptidase